MSDKSGDKEKLPWGLKEVAPGSIKSLTPKELEAFEIGVLNTKKKHLSKKELEELRKKQEDQAAAQILDDFVASFENANNKTMPKMFVKGSVINPLSKDEKPAPDKGNIYAPALKMIGKVSTSVQSPKPSTQVKKDPSDLAAVAALAELKKRNNEKRKSNLELFKEELKRMQMEREERAKKRQSFRPEDGSLDKPAKSDTDIKSENDLSYENESSQDSSTTSTSNKPNSVEDPNTTNIFISNLSPKTVEQDLVDRFGAYGLLASVKIMWPRTDEEKARNANCGFVAFMCRKDAENALRELDGCLENGQTMRLSWSKAITLPSKPFYIPPELVDVIIPPPPSNLPFNAQFQDSNKLKEFKRKLKNKYKERRSRRRNSSYSSSRSRSSSSSRSSSHSSSRYSSSSESESSSSKYDNNDFNKILASSIVRVVIPTDRNLLCLIHRMVEFVIKEGPAFEAMIMTKEINNPQFRFLFDNQSPAHTYYRWKLFSLLNGDSTFKWRTKPFKMFKTGSYWQPPPINKYTQGCPDEAFDKVQKELDQKKKKLSIVKKEKLEEIFKNLSTERKSISEAMIFCIENAESVEEIVEMLNESFNNLDSPLNKTIARLFLISDILHNCIVKVANASLYRKGFEGILPSVFDNLNKIFGNIEGKMKSESFKQKILSCIRAWEDWAIYPNDYLVNLQNRFLGLLNQNLTQSDSKSELKKESDSDVDVDGKPIEESELNKSEDADRKDESSNDELDGKPLDEEVSENKAKAKFVTSKWETVDPNNLEKQAITTSKWDFFDENNAKNESLRNLTLYGSDDENEEPGMNRENSLSQDDEDIDGKPMEEEKVSQETNNKNSDPKKKSNSKDDEEKRKLLREVELKTLKYIDDIENGKIPRKEKTSIQEQAEAYRNELIKKIDEKIRGEKENISSQRSHKENVKQQSQQRPRSHSRSSSSSSSSSKSSKKKQKRCHSRSPQRSSRSSYSSSYSSQSSQKRKYK